MYNSLEHSALRLLPVPRTDGPGGTGKTSNSPVPSSLPSCLSWAYKVNYPRESSQSNDPAGLLLPFYYTYFKRISQHFYKSSGWKSVCTSFQFHYGFTVLVWFPTYPSMSPSKSKGKILIMSPQTRCPWVLVTWTNISVRFMPHSGNTMYLNTFNRFIVPCICRNYSCSLLFFFILSIFNALFLLKLNLFKQTNHLSISPISCHLPLITTDLFSVSPYVREIYDMSFSVLLFHSA